MRSFCEAIAQELGGEYGLACEHEHSNLVLLARRFFYRFPGDVATREDGSIETLLDEQDRFGHLPTDHIIYGNDTSDASGVTGCWYTWIDYSRFHKLAAR